jgi:hypothetical protein
VDPAAQQRHFAKRGFAVFPGVLDAGEVQRLRSYLAQLFAEPPSHKGDRQEIRNDIYSRYEPTRFLLSHPPALEALRTVVGENLVALPEMAVHDSGFGGWHKDTATLDNAGETWHHDASCRMVQAAIYLQPNTEYGGGLDIVPGSHLDRPGASLPKRVVRRFRRPYTIPSQAGDMVIFDMRADHRATPPTACEPGELPPEHRKFALFSVWSSTEEHAQRYRGHIEAKKGYDYLEGHEYPEEVRDLARDNEFALA